MLRLATSFFDATRRIMTGSSLSVYGLGEKGFHKAYYCWLVSVFGRQSKMHLINFKELSTKELNALVDLGIEVKHNPKKFCKSFEGKSFALIFQKTSTRTRVSFEVAATQLGGHGLFIDWRTTNFTWRTYQMKSVFVP